jgi:thiamine-phosphate pyrophosphorylase
MQLVLHQQHQLALDFGINRIHFTENARATLDLESTNNRDDFVKSTSTHTMADFNKLDHVLNTHFESDTSKYF